jgi:predicted GNAT family N-acyltransferase
VGLRVEIRSWEEAQKAAQPIRYAIFLAEKNAQGIELDEVDPQCAHALAYDEGGESVVGTGRLLPDGQIGRLAVLPDWRRRGVGAAIIEALIEEARRRGYAEVTLSAPLQAAEFYRGLGFVAAGRIVKEGGLLQQKMRKTLA